MDDHEADKQNWPLANDIDIIDETNAVQLWPNHEAQEENWGIPAHG